MSAVTSLSSRECVEIIRQAEVEQLVSVSIEHFVIPVIAGASMDELSQEKFTAMGGKGIKPPPLSMEKKMAIYERMRGYLRLKILETTAELVNVYLPGSLDNLKDEELCRRALALRGKALATRPSFDRLHDLFADHVCLFKELQPKSLLRVNLVEFHDILCPIMCKFRDSGALFRETNIKEFYE